MKLEVTGEHKLDVIHILLKNGIAFRCFESDEGGTSLITFYLDRTDMSVVKCEWFRDGDDGVIGEYTIEEAVKEILCIVPEDGCWDIFREEA